MGPITPELFEILLNWLDPDRDEAGQKYEVIRLALIKMFVARGCYDSENLADIAIDRVASRVEDIKKEYVGNPAHYFRGVGNKVYLEYLKNRREDNLEIDIPIEVPEIFGNSYECLNECLHDLPEKQRELILEYYSHNGKDKVQHRRALAAALGIAVNTLRLRAHRIRNILESCVEKCLELIKK